MSSVGSARESLVASRGRDEGCSVGREVEGKESSM